MLRQNFAPLPQGGVCRPQAAVGPLGYFQTWSSQSPNVERAAHKQFLCHPPAFTPNVEFGIPTAASVPSPNLAVAIPKHRACYPRSASGSSPNVNFAIPNIELGTLPPCAIRSACTALPCAVYTRGDGGGGGRVPAIVCGYVFLFIKRS